MNTSESLYERLGGEVVLHKFVIHFYEYMDNTPDVADVRSMHPDSLISATEKLFMFLSGMLGGPSLYMDEFGPPRLRRKHLHFTIGDKERDQWLMCAQYAANQLNIDEGLRDELIDNLTAMAKHLQNFTGAEQ